MKQDIYESSFAQDAAMVEFKSEIVDCKKKADYILDIYREVVAAFEKKETDSSRGKGINMALNNAFRAKIITELDFKRMKEDASAIPSSDDLGDLQENMEKTIFNIPFNCALNAIRKLKIN